MKFGVTISNSAAFLDLKTAIQAACRAEELGYDSIFFSDHYMTPYSPDWYETYEALTLISFLAARTSKIRLGTCVTPIPFRPPGILAKIISTLDNLSNGRIILGVGAGWVKGEFEAYSHWDENPVRVNKTEEALRLILRLWTEDEVDFKGKYYTAKGAVLKPKPVQKPHPPLWFGTLGEYMLKLTAKYGDGWIPWVRTTPQEYEEKAKRLMKYADEMNREGKITLACVIGQITKEGLKPIIDDVPSVTNWDKTVERYLAAGCRYPVLWFHPKKYIKLMEEFSEEVAPSF